MRYIFFILMTVAWCKAQSTRLMGNQSDTIVIDNGNQDSAKIFKPTIADYKYRTQWGTAKVFDTTFAVNHSYQYTQYNNRDNFGKIQFANIGAGFQDLVYSPNAEQALSLLPTNKSHFILGINDVKYYDVKTPTTSFIYHSAMRNGAALQSTYTQNIGKNFNFALEYMGLRSQGFYTNSLSANNNVVLSAHFKTPNQKYEAYAHFIHQNVNSQENGGIQDLDVFLSGDSRFSNRQNIPVNLTGSDSRFSYRRYYYSHSFAPFDVAKYPFKVKHTLFHQGNKYYFNLGSNDLAFFEAVDATRALSSRKYYDNLSNTVSLVWDNEKFKLDAGLRHQNIVLGAENGILGTGYLAGYKTTENRLGAVGSIEVNLWNRFALHSFLEYSNGNAFGNFLSSKNQVKFEPIKDYFIDAKLNFQSAAPSFNYLMNASPILNYNHHFTNFKNENIVELGGSLGVKWFNAQLQAQYFRIDNFAYFDAQGQPQQSATSLNVSQIGGKAHFNYRKWHLDTQLLFQANLTHKELLPMPNFIGRANVYWQSKAFKNAAEIMTGLKGYFFTQFDSRMFSPAINEFLLPGTSGYAIGGQPILDAYFNLRVKTMQIYVEAQNFTTTLMQNKSYTVPYYPLYDFRLNIGIVWRLFH